MADDIKFVIGVDDDDVVKTLKNTEKLEKEVKSLEKEYKRLAKAQNSGKISAQAYAAGVAQVDTRIAKLNKVLASGHVAVNKYAETLVQSKNKMNRFGMVSQQVGYQVGDFFVQVQSGTNALVAFGQQGTQLAGLLPGVYGAVVGIGLSIGTLLVKSYMDSQDAANLATEAYKESEKALEDLKNKVEEAEGVISSFASVLSNINSSEIERAWENLAETTSGQFSATFVEQILRNIGDTLRGQVVADSDLAGTLAGEKFAKAFGQETMAVDLPFIEDAIKGKDLFALDNIIDYLSAFTQVDATGQAFLKSLIEIRNELNDGNGIARSMAGEIKKAYESGAEIAGLDLTYGIETARKAAELLAENMNISLEKALSLVNLATSATQGPVSRGRGRSAGAGSTEIERILMGMGGEYTPYKDSPEAKPAASKKKKDPLEELRKRITLEEQLFGKTEAQRQVMQALGVDYEKVYGKEATDQIIGRINKIKELQKEEDKLADIAQNIGSSFESAFTSMVDGTSSVKDAFRNMARDIVAYLFEVLVMQRAINSFGGMLSGSSNPIVSTVGSKLESYDGGGYTGSGPRSGGMDGRGGRLAMIHPQETVVDHTKANSGSGEQIVINQSFNFAANGDESVKKLIAQAAPQIANMTQKQIIDSRRRGGTLKSTFG